jgi:hypothetical protein
MPAVATHGYFPIASCVQSLQAMRVSQHRSRAVRCVQRLLVAFPVLPSQPLTQEFHHTVNESKFNLKNAQLWSGLSRKAVGMYR